MILQGFGPDQGFSCYGPALYEAFKLFCAIGTVALLIYDANKVPLLLRLRHLERIIKLSGLKSQARNKTESKQRLISNKADLSGGEEGEVDLPR